jgi:hypothetical protein
VAVVARREWGVKTDWVAVEPSGSCSFLCAGELPQVAFHGAPHSPRAHGRVPELLAAGVEARSKEGTGGQTGLLDILGDCLGSRKVQPDRPPFVVLLM